MDLWPKRGDLYSSKVSDADVPKLPFDEFDWFEGLRSTLLGIEMEEVPLGPLKSSSSRRDCSLSSSSVKGFRTPPPPAPISSAFLELRTGDENLLKVSVADRLILESIPSPPGGGECGG